MSRIVLPFPPSVNGAFRRHNGAHLSERYRKWRDEAGWELKRQHPQKHIGPVSVSIVLCPPDRRKRDADNCFKAVLDLLVAHGIIEGDDTGTVRELSARVVDSGEPCVVTVDRTSADREAAFQRAVKAGLFAGLNAPKEVA